VAAASTGEANILVLAVAAKPEVLGTTGIIVTRRKEAAKQVVLQLHQVAKI